MQIEKDIEVACNFANGKIEPIPDYKPVKLFINTSLKHFKNYKLKGKKVLTKYNTGDEVIELLSYGSDVTCYSSNRLDEYFLYLKLAFLMQINKQYFSYFFKDYGKKKHDVFSKEGYLLIRNELNEKTKYFFDELFKRVHGNVLYSKLFTRNNYSYEELSRYVRYTLSQKYFAAQENLKNSEVLFKFATDAKIQLELKDKLFYFINLSYSLDHMDEKRIKFIIDKIDKDFKPMLTEYGRIQCFQGKTDIDIDDYEKLEQTIVLNQTQENLKCKKDYAYVYVNK